MKGSTFVLLSFSSGLLALNGALIAGATYTSCGVTVTRGVGEGETCGVTVTCGIDTTCGTGVKCGEITVIAIDGVDAKNAINKI